MLLHCSNRAANCERGAEKPSGLSQLSQSLVEGVDYVICIRQVEAHRRLDPEDIAVIASFTHQYAQLP